MEGPRVRLHPAFAEGVREKGIQMVPPIAVFPSPTEKGQAGVVVGHHAIGREALDPIPSGAGLRDIGWNVLEAGASGSLTVMRVVADRGGIADFGVQERAGERGVRAEGAAHSPTDTGYVASENRRGCANVGAVGDGTALCIYA